LIHQLSSLLTFEYPAIQNKPTSFEALSRSSSFYCICRPWRELMIDRTRECNVEKADTNTGNVYMKLMKATQEIARSWYNIYTMFDQCHLASTEKPWSV